MFARTVCLNLDRRPDRWGTFLAALPGDWPFPKAERWSAYDGRDMKRPDGWWQRSAGAWGCLWSHVAIWRALIASGDSAWLVLEDDAFCCESFTAQATAFLGAVPPDWSQIYLGGQHLTGWAPRGGPAWVWGRNVNRTHAYAISARFARLAEQYVSAAVSYGVETHVDYLLGDLHRLERWLIACPPRWLVGQAEGISDVVAGRRSGRRLWHEFGCAKKDEG